MPTSLDSIFFAGPYLVCYCLRSRPHLSVVPRQLLSAPFSNQLSFASPYHFRIRRDFRSKNPLSGFAPKQTKESSAWRATYIVLHHLDVPQSENHRKRKERQVLRPYQRTKQYMEHDGNDDVNCNWCWKRFQKA